MSSRRRFLLPALLCLSGPAAAEVAPVEVFQLEDAVLKASRNSAGLQNAEQDITIAEQRVREARYLFYPDIGLQGSATRFESRYPFALRSEMGSSLLFPSNEDTLFSGKAYMTLSLYEGRRHINTLRLAQTSLKQARTKYEAVKLDIIYETKRAFYSLILAQTLAAAAEEAAPAGERREEPYASGLEAVEVESLMAELRAKNSKARHVLALARLDFLRVLNRELDTPVRVEGRLETKGVDVDLRKALLWATELRPELQAQTYRSQMDAIAVNLTLGRRTPSVVLGLDYELLGQEFPIKQNNWDATIGVRLPFALNFWTQHTQKVAEQRQGEIRRSDLRDQVQLQVRRAHQELAYWQAEWPRREGEYLRLKSLLAHGKGAGALSAAGLRASASVLDAGERHLEAVVGHILARARLERAVGRPLSNVP